MKRIISWMHPSVWILTTAFLLILSCKEPSNFESGNNAGMVSKETQLSEPPPPPPTENDALKRTDVAKQYKSKGKRHLED